MDREFKEIFCFIGTRPEAIKMAPVILCLQRERWARVTVVSTGQHKDLVASVLEAFNVKLNHDMEVMTDNQSLSSLTARILVLGAEFFSIRGRPDLILVQGDTSSVFAISLSAFFLNIPIAHIEAGLRTFDFRSPFPEEMNRVFTSRLAKWHFAPTSTAADNLRSEGIPLEAITVTGNTVIDALFRVKRVELNFISHIGGKRLILVTTHRRENFGEPLVNILSAVKKLACEYVDIMIVFPLHPNPNVHAVALDILSDCANVLLCPPLEYPEFVETMRRSYFIVTDSGGVQEEAPALGVPVLVVRQETERPEGVAAGVSKLIGTSFESIYSNCKQLLDSTEEHLRMANGASPYGDGNASELIVNRLHRDLTM